MASVAPARKGPINAESAEFLAAAKLEADRAVLHRKNVLEHVGSANYTSDYFHVLEPDDWKHSKERTNVNAAEVQLGKRCHGAHLETMAADVTPAGSHYLLIHYDVPLIDADTFKLKIHGLVERELEISLSELKKRKTFTASVLMACAGNGRMGMKDRFIHHVPWGPDAFGCANWTGCSLSELLQDVGLKPGAKQVIFTGADKGVEWGKVDNFRRSMTVDQAMTGHIMLCWEMNGAPLLACHGAPLRIIVPGWYGMASVKWLTDIKVTEGGWWGTEMQVYCYRTHLKDPTPVPLEQLPVRALMVPPGHPDFYSRTRLVPPGTIRTTGRAWSGAIDIDYVQFSQDGGMTWNKATVGAKTGVFGWAAWHVDWEAVDGTTYILTCRAVDVRGRTQDEKDSKAFNYTGMGSTQPQMIYVKCTKAIETIESDIDLELESRAAVDPTLLTPELYDALYLSPGSQ